MNARSLAAVALLAAAIPAPAAVAQAPARAGEPPPARKLEPLPPAAEPPAPSGPPLTLADALARARDSSPDLAVARERVVQAQNNLSRAWSAFQPTLSAGASYTRNSYESVTQYVDSSSGTPQLLSFTTVKKDQLAGNVSAGITLFNARAFPALDTARDQIEVGRLGETQTRRELLLTVAATYFSGLQQRELLLAAFRRSKAALDQLRQAESRYEAGLIQKAAAVRAQLDAVSADQEARRQVFALEATKSQLATLLDRRDTAFELQPAPEPPADLKGEYQQLLQRALADRPEMASQKLSEQITARTRTDAWAQFLPTLNLSGQLRTNNADLFPGEDRWTWAITLALSLPLYDGGFRYAQLKDAASQERAAAAQTRSQALKIEDELRRALIDLDTARMLRDTSARAFSVAQENERLARAQFEAGTSTQIEVSDAEASLYQAEANWLQEKLAVQLSALRLAKAVGAFDP